MRLRFNHYEPFCVYTCTLAQSFLQSVAPSRSSHAKRKRASVEEVRAGKLITRWELSGGYLVYLNPIGFFPQKENIVMLTCVFAYKNMSFLQQSI